MPGSFKDTTAICPFYKGLTRKRGKLEEADKKSIICNDDLLSNGYELELYFKNSRERDEYKSTHCDTWNYEKCKAYRAMGYTEG